MGEKNTRKTTINVELNDKQQKMYQAIRRNNFQIDIDDERFMIENDGFEDYGQWNKLFKKIISI